MKRATRLMRLAHDLRGEADRWHGGTRDELIRAATQLVRLASCAAVSDPDRAMQIDVFEEAATNLLVRLMTDRASSELARGVAP